jgi:hypothetical protein
MCHFWWREWALKNNPPGNGINLIDWNNEEGETLREADRNNPPADIVDYKAMGFCA